MNGNHSRPAPGPRQLRRVALVLVAGALTAGLAGCGDGPGGDGPLVVATHSVLGDLVANVVGDEATIEVALPAGTDPHEFEPSAADAALLSEADLIVANGLGFEEGLDDALAAAADAGVPVLALGDELEALELRTGGDDPHWFLDPARFAQAAALVGDAAGEVDGVDAAAVADRAAEYRAEVEALDAEVEDLVAAVPGADRQLVTNHDVFGYFAERYGFEVVGTVIPGGSTLAEPSSAELGDLVEVVEEAGVPAVFVDHSAPADLAEVLVEETGEPIEVVELYSESLGDEGSGAETYLEMIRTDVERIVEALTR